MSNDIVPQEDDRPAMGPGVQLMQKVGTLCAKAALEKIWWAGLVFDVGQAVIDFGNARQTERLLTSMGDRIDGRGDKTRERLKRDEVYQLSAQAAIRRMMTEINPRMADALARAVTELGVSGLQPTERMEVVRALDVLTEPGLHLLQSFYRVQHGLLTEPELQVVDGDVTKPYSFTALMYASMPLTSWLAPASDLERSGLVEATLDDGWFGEAREAARADEGHAVHLRKVYKIGERVVRMCFDDPAIPAFGMFAP